MEILLAVKYNEKHTEIFEFSSKAKRREFIKIVRGRGLEYSYTI